MISDLKKSFVVLAAMAAPLFVTAQASANTVSNEVNHQAVNQFTQTIRETLSTYDLLNQGNVTAAKSKLNQALRNLDSAIAKDPTLSLSDKSGNAFRADLNRVKAKLNTGDRFQAKLELANVLSSAGIITAS